MVQVVAHNYINPEDVDKAMPFFKGLVEGTASEPGYISYQLFQDLKEPGHFIMIEQWDNADCLGPHSQTENFKTNARGLKPYTAKPAEVHVLKKVEF